LARRCATGWWRANWPQGAFRREPIRPAPPPDGGRPSGQIRRSRIDGKIVDDNLLTARDAIPAFTSRVGGTYANAGLSGPRAFGRKFLKEQEIYG
jgi:hypothetical protein